MEGGLIPSEGRTDKKYIVQNPNKPWKRKQRVGLMNGDKNAIINSQSKMRQKNERKRNKEEMRWLGTNSKMVGLNTIILKLH